MTKDVPNYCTNGDSGVLRVFVIRHGQTAENSKKILQGHLDTSINEIGIDQAQKLGKCLAQDRDIVFDKIYTSDLKRCQQTLAEILKSYDTKPEIEIDAGLRERAMGVIQGMYLRDAEEYALKQGKSSFREFGESAEVFERRLTSKVAEIVESSLDLKNIALVSHGGSIRQILKWLGYKELDIHKIIVYNTSVTIIDYFKDDKRYQVQSVGNTQHLGDGEFIVSDLKLR